MSKIRTAGIYMIKISGDPKVYIGESIDLNMRWKKYVWAVKTDRTYHETTRSITQAMKRAGISNCQFIILESGAKFINDEYRAAKEIEYIERYKANDPDFGYNDTAGGETGAGKPRKQKAAERLLRSKPAILYDIKKDIATLYFGGAKAIGEDFGYGKDVMSHTINRGSLFLNRYYIIPFSVDQLNRIIEKLSKKKLDNVDQPKKARSHSANAFNAYMKAVSRVRELFEY